MQIATHSELETMILSGKSWGELYQLSKNKQIN